MDRDATMASVWGVATNHQLNGLEVAWKWLQGRVRNDRSTPDGTILAAIRALDLAASGVSGSDPSSLMSKQGGKMTGDSIEWEMSGLSARVRARTRLEAATRNAVQKWEVDRMRRGDREMENICP